MHGPSAGRVALFLNDLPVGGAERAMVTLLRGLVDRVACVDLVLVRRRGALLADVPERVHVAELGKDSRGRLLRLLLRLWWRGGVGIGARRLFTGRLPAAARSLPRLLAWIERERPDAILTTMADNNIVVLWAAALARHPVRAVVREANSFSDEVSAAQRSTDDVLPALARAWYPRAAAVVAVSQGVADDLARTLALPAGRLAVILNPVDVETVGRRAQESCEEPWLTDAGPPVVLAVGRLEPQKDFATLLRAFARVRAVREARLVILGEGVERPALERLAAELKVAPDVKLPGRSANPFPAMARAAVLVLSSRFEGFPNVLAEALACGCPVVATDCPSGPREILDGGRFGRLVPVGDDAGLAEAIAATLDAPPDRGTLVQRARAFGLDRASDHYAQLLLGDAPSGCGTTGPVLPREPAGVA